MSASRNNMVSLRSRYRELDELYADADAAMPRGVQRSTVYPWNGKFRSKEEVDRYLGCETIVCLLCGQQFKRLSGSHIEAAHQIDAARYRERYGIPLKRGLVCQSTSRLRRAIALEPANLQRLAGNRLHPHWREAQSNDRTTFRRGPDWVTADLRKVNRGKRQFAAEQFKLIVDRMCEGIALGAICKEDNMPSRSSFDRRVKDDPAFAAYFTTRLEAAPFKVQAICHKLGNRFSSDVAALHSRGLSVAQIAEQTEVSVRSVANVLATARRKLS